MILHNDYYTFMLTHIGYLIKPSIIYLSRKCMSNAMHNKLKIISVSTIQNVVHGG